MYDAELREKINTTMSAVAEQIREAPAEPEPVEWHIAKTLVEIEVDAAGMGQTTIGGVKVGHVVQGFYIESGVGGPTRIRLDLVAMPVKLKAIAEVILVDRQLDQIDPSILDEPEA